MAATPTKARCWLPARRRYWCRDPGSGPERCADAAGAIRNLAAHNTAATAALLSAGAAPHLVRLASGRHAVASGVARTGKFLFQRAAMEALYNLSDSEEQHPQLVAAGAAPVAAQCLALASCRHEVQVSAICLLQGLAATVDGAHAIMECGAIPRMVYLLGAASHEQIQIEAAAAGVNLTAHESSAAAWVAAGGVPALLRVLQHSLSSQQAQQAEVREQAVMALANLTELQHTAAVAAEEGGALAVSQLLLAPGSSDSKSSAADVLRRLALEQPRSIDARTAAVAATGLVGFIAECPRDRQSQESGVAAPERGAAAA